MSSYEKGLEPKVNNKEKIEGKLDISTLKYFWQSNPLSGDSKGNIPKFFKALKVFKSFSENERRILSKYFHIRSFEPKELVFEQGDPGFGFYFILSGHVEIFTKDSSDDISLKDLKEKDIQAPYVERHIFLLEKYDYFGELALIQEDGIRTASAMAKDSTVLLGIFKPDLEELIQDYPVIAAKLLQAISVIVANRFSSATKDIKILKYKLGQLEGSEN